MPKKETFDLEELHNKSIKQMTEKEKDFYITEARNYIGELQAKEEALDIQLKKRFEDMRTMQSEHEQYRNKVRARLGFIIKAVSTLHDSIMLGVRMEEL